MLTATVEEYVDGGPLEPVGKDVITMPFAVRERYLRGHLEASWSLHLNPDWPHPPVTPLPRLPQHGGCRWLSPLVHTGRSYHHLAGARSIWPRTERTGIGKSVE